MHVKFDHTVRLNKYKLLLVEVEVLEIQKIHV